MRLSGLPVRIVLVSTLMVIPLLLFWQIAGMDGRFFPSSWAGAEGLLRYLAGDYRGAAGAYRAHLKSRVAAEREHIDLASAALLEGRLADARARAEEQLKRGFSPGALLTVAEVALAENDPRQALETLNRVLQLDPDEYDAQLLSAVAHARLGQHAAAIDSMTRALRQNRVERRITVFLTIMESVGDLAGRPAHERPECLLAHYHRYLRIYDSAEGAVALRHARRAIASGDHADAAWVTMGLVYTKQGKISQAVAAFHEGARLNPRNPEAARWLARHYSDRGDLVSELHFAKAAFEAAPEDAYYANVLHHVLAEKLGDYRQANEIYRAAVTARPETAALWGKLGEAQYQLGDFAGALQAHSRAAALAPSTPGHLVHQGWALMALEQHEKAREVFQRAVALDPEESEAHYALGTVYYRLDRFPEATAALERSFALKVPENSNRLVALCGLYRRMVDFERTHACLRIALRLDPKNQQALRWMRDVEQNLALKRGTR